jgi:hypothetical protein
MQWSAQWPWYTQHPYIEGIVYGKLRYKGHSATDERFKSHLLHLIDGTLQGIMSRAILGSCIWLHTFANLTHLELLLGENDALPNRLVIAEKERLKFRMAQAPKQGYWFKNRLDHCDMWGLVHGLMLKNHADRTRHDMKIKLVLVNGVEHIPGHRSHAYSVMRKKRWNLMAQARVLGWETGEKSARECSGTNH